MAIVLSFLISLMRARRVGTLVAFFPAVGVVCTIGDRLLELGKLVNRFLCARVGALGLYLIVRELVRFCDDAFYLFGCCKTHKGFFYNIE